MPIDSVRTDIRTHPRASEGSLLPDDALIASALDARVVRSFAYHCRPRSDWPWLSWRLQEHREPQILDSPLGQQVLRHPAPPRGGPDLGSRLTSPSLSCCRALQSQAMVNLRLIDSARCVKSGLDPGSPDYQATLALSEAHGTGLCAAKRATREPRSGPALWVQISPPMHIEEAQLDEGAKGAPQVPAPRRNALSLATGTRHSRIVRGRR